MKRSLAILTVAVALVATTTAVAAAGSHPGVEKQDIVQVFEAPYEASGTVKLIRRDDGLKATAKVSGLIPGGVYTMWWVVGEVGFNFAEKPETIPETFVASAGGQVVGSNGKMTIRMNADFGQPGIEGFAAQLTGTDPDPATAPFRPSLDVELATAEIHVEIAYHGQAEDISDVDEALGNFWSGPACPNNNGGNPGGSPEQTGGDFVVSNPAQPHCPVSYVAVFTP